MRNLCIQYPGRLLFNDVNLDAEDHEIIAIKTCLQDGSTSLLKGIGGLLGGTPGSVHLGGRDVLGRKDLELIHRIGYVYETKGLVSLLNIQDNILLPLRYFAVQFHRDLSGAEVQRRLDDICGMLQIDPGIMHLDPHHINYVQMRLVNLARALIVQPLLLLIDELETGMSDLFLKRTLEAIRQYQRDNPTPIIITAMGAPVLDNADRVYRIENRSLIEEP